MMGEPSYIERELATVEDLKPNARLYLDTGGIKCVAKIGSSGNWTALIAFCAENWTLDWVSNYGFELSEYYAVKLFPICKRANLSYSSANIQRRDCI